MPERSLLCATPFLILKLAESSEKSVFSTGLAAADFSPLSAPSLAFAWRSEPAISTPLIAPSASRIAAVPFSAFLIAVMVLPCPLTSSETLPLPSSESKLAASFNMGPMLMPVRFCLTAMTGVAAACTERLPASAPWYRFAAIGLMSRRPFAALISTRTFAALTLETLSDPILMLPFALRPFSAEKSSGWSGCFCLGSDFGR